MRIRQAEPADMEGIRAFWMEADATGVLDAVLFGGTHFKVPERPKPRLVVDNEKT